jgi:hypothetical protein
MREVIFENLNYSFLIDAENKIAYLQEWQNGNWSEAERYHLPQSLAALPKQSRLSRALSEFRRTNEYPALCEALGDRPQHQPSGFTRLGEFLQDGPRFLVQRIAQLIYA